MKKYLFLFLNLITLTTNIGYASDPAIAQNLGLNSKNATLSQNIHLSEASNSNASQVPPQKQNDTWGTLDIFNHSKWIYNHAKNYSYGALTHGGYALSRVLSDSLNNALNNALNYGLNNALNCGLNNALNYGLTYGLIYYYDSVKNKAKNLIFVNCITNFISGYLFDLGKIDKKIKNNLFPAMSLYALNHLAPSMNFFHINRKWF